MTTPEPRSTHTHLWIIAGMILAAAATRLLPHPPNFTPIGAMALFAGAMLRDRRLAVLVPLAALVMSDYMIGLMQGPGYGFHRSQVFVYAGFLLITLLGRVLQNHRRSPWRIGAASLAASTLFFVVTNFGVWLASGMYALNTGGLAQCFVQAIPFFGNTVAGDLVYATVLFGGLAMLEAFVTSDQRAPVLGDDAD